MLPATPPAMPPIAAPVQALPPEIAAIPAPAPAPIAAPLIVPCCCGVIVVHPTIVAARRDGQNNPRDFIVRLRQLAFFSPGTTISNQIVSMTGRCSLPGFWRTSCRARRARCRASRPAGLWPSAGGCFARLLAGVAPSYAISTWTRLAIPMQIGLLRCAVDVVECSPVTSGMSAARAGPASTASVMTRGDRRSPQPQFHCHDLLHDSSVIESVAALPRGARSLPIRTSSRSWRRGRSCLRC